MCGHGSSGDPRGAAAGELKPTAGEIERHPNLRIAYIAQHAFHHLESHLMATPVQYIIRRYEHGEDEEEAEKVRPGPRVARAVHPTSRRIVARACA